MGAVSLVVEQGSLTGCSVSTTEKFSKGISVSGVDTDTLFGAAHCFPLRSLWPLHGCLQLKKLHTCLVPTVQSMNGKLKYKRKRGKCKTCE